MKVRYIFFAVVIIVCIVFLALYIRTVTEKNDRVSLADEIFSGSFSRLCSTLNEQESAETNKECEKHAYLCFSVFSLTSFAENEEMNRIVHILYDLSERGILYAELDVSCIEKLNRLSQSIDEPALISEVYKALSK